MDYGLPAVLALILFPFLAFVALFPYVAVQFRRRGRLGFGHTLLTSGLLVYVLALIFYTMVPIPDDPDYCDKRAPISPQLRPFQFIDDIRKEASNTGLPSLLGNPALEQVVLNVILFLPLGMLARHLFRLNIAMTTLAGFCVSLLIETTQLTGVWYLFPCPYRLFDVDDLMMNTAGALMGALAAPALRLIDRPPVAQDSGGPRRVTAWRRLLGMICDATLVVVCGQSLVIAASLAEEYFGDGRFSPDQRPFLQDLLLWFVPGGILLVLIPLIAGGRSPGQWAVMLRTARGDRVPPPRWRVLIQLAAGPVPILALLVLGSLGRYMPLAAVLVAVNVAAALLPDHRGLSGWISGLRFADARAARTEPESVRAPSPGA